MPNEMSFFEFNNVTYEIGDEKARQSLAECVNNGYYDSNAKKIILRHDSDIIVQIDATDFIKDGMVSNVQIINGYLVITFNTDSGQEPISIPITDIFDPANYYTKVQTDNLLGGKQDTIQDLATIRSGASAGATAVQPSAMSAALVATVAESGVYDVTANNDNAKFASLSALLSSENLDTLIPVARRRGGMSIKYVCTSDNKYVKFFCTAQNFTTDTTQWQGVDDEPLAGSDNLVKSGGVYYQTHGFDIIDYRNTENTNRISINTNNWVEKTEQNYGCILPVEPNKKYKISVINQYVRYAFLKTSGSEAGTAADYCDGTTLDTVQPGNTEFLVSPSDANFIYLLKRENNIFRIFLFGEYNYISAFKTREDISEVSIGKSLVYGSEALAKSGMVCDAIAGTVVRNVFNHDDTDVVEDKIIAANGGVLSGTYTDYITTGFIPCGATECFRPANAVGNFTVYCCFFDSSKTAIQSAYINGSQVGYIEVPNNANIAYMRVSIKKAVLGSCLYNSKVLYNFSVAYNELVVSRLNNHETRIGQSEENVAELQDKQAIVVYNVVNQNDPDYKQGKLLMNGTRLDDYSDYDTTGYIPAKANDAFRLVNRISNYKTWWGWYDKDKQKIGSYNENNNGKHPYLLVPDNADIAYIRVTIKWNVDDLGKSRTNIALYKTTEYVGVVKPYGERFILNTDTIYSDIGSVQENLENLNLNSGIWKYAADKLICFGDSLTDGLYTQGLGVSLIQQNYPYYLGRMLNTTVENAGKNGSYPSKCLSEKLPIYTMTDYNTIIIWFGTNGGLRVTDDDTGYETASPEHQYMCYKSILESIQADNADCKIWLGTVFLTGRISESVTKASVSETNEAINTLASTYGCRVIDFSDLGYTNHPELHVNTNDTHFGKAGNIFIANRIIRDFEQYFGGDVLNCEYGLNTKEAHNP